MYVPQPFAETDVARLHALVRAYPFGVITSLVDGRLTATHLPFLLEPAAGAHGTLHAHMARANPHWQGFDGTAEALVVFSGPHGYVSPTWYTKRPAVPTWNYVAVHAYGCPVIVEDAAQSRAHLGRLAANFEAARVPQWRIDDEPADFIDGMVKGVVAFQLEISRLEGKAKLSQNRGREDRIAVAEALRGEGDVALADIMDSRETP